MEVAVKSYSVKDLMVPLSEYATVAEDATLYEAVLALEAAQEKFEDKHTRYSHRAILVLDKRGTVVGKLSHLHVLKALEPKYQDMIQGEGSHRFGFTKQFMQSMLEDYHLFAGPLDHADGFSEQGDPPLILRQDHAPQVVHPCFKTLFSLAEILDLVDLYDHALTSSSPFCFTRLNRTSNEGTAHP